MKIWQMMCLYQAEQEYCQNDFLEELLISEGYYDILEIYKNYSNTSHLLPREVLDRLLPEELVVKFIQKSLRVYYIENNALKEYLIPQLLSPNLQEEIVFQKEIKESELLEAIEVYYQYEVETLLEIQEKGKKIVNNQTKTALEIVKSTHNELIISLEIDKQQRTFVFSNQYDIDIFRIKGDINISEPFLLPHLSKPIMLHTGFIGLNLGQKEIYDIFLFLLRLGIPSHITPIEYKEPKITQKEAFKIAFEHFQSLLPQITEKDIVLRPDTIYSWTFLETLSLANSDKEFAGATSYVTIDKLDGHLYFRREILTLHYEVYYLEINTLLSLEEIKEIISKYSQSVDVVPIEYGSIKQAFIFDTLYLEVTKSRRINKLSNGLSFESNALLTFSIPKYKKGYQEGRSELKTLLSLFMDKLAISKAKMITSFDEMSYVLEKYEESLTIKDNFFE